jgi:hypothetical protein
MRDEPSAIVPVDAADGLSNMNALHLRNFTSSRASQKGDNPKYSNL